jgi:hypothetical protein
MSRRILITGLEAIAVILIGIMVAWQISLGPNENGEPARDIVITELRIGTPQSAAEITRPDPKLRQQSNYSTEDPIALRLVTTNALASNTEVSVRLLDENRAVHELIPSQITIQPGTSTFCCWTVTQPGEYTLQVFRPEKVISSLPLIITRATGAPPPSLLNP